MKRHLLLTMLAAIGLAFTNSPGRAAQAPQIFHVDPAKGRDTQAGTVAAPFQSLDHALKVVAERVAAGVVSDRIYLRGGVYRKTSTRTLYRLDLRGTPADYAMISAMPAEPHAPGAVQRKSGRWYERVIFDDAWVIGTRWERHPDLAHVWTTKPGYTQLEWTHQNVWPWTIAPVHFPISDKDATPDTTKFTVAPYMLLQDGEPTIWVDSPQQIDAPGTRYYDQDTGVLYFRPLGDVDPNRCKIETWYGGPEDYPAGTLHLDGEGRALFNGNMEYAGIRGVEFRMFNKLFEFNRRGYPSQADRVRQRHVLFEDNHCEYGWMQILLDGNTVFAEEDGRNLPRYHDRSNWIVRNNVFFRPGREVCQLHGDDHLFEFNEVIDHNGPWAGPASCVSIINTRNTRNFRVRGNHFTGQGNSRYARGSVFMIETGREHADESGDYLFGGQTYEHNIIENVTDGQIFVLGKGGARMRNITIRHNVISGSRRDAAILVCNPQWNLTIEHNVFHDQREVIAVRDLRGMGFDGLPSSISIRKNIFANNDKLFDARLLTPPAGSAVVIDHNVFFQNKVPAVGTHLREGDPRFLDPAAGDFRTGAGSSAVSKGPDFGVYDQEGPVPTGTDWWRLGRGPWLSRKLPAGSHSRSP